MMLIKDTTLTYLHKLESNNLNSEDDPVKEEWVKLSEKLCPRDQ